MLSPEKNRLAAEAMECWADFQDGLSSDKRKYPIQQFKAFWAVAKRYAELTRSDHLIHRSLAGAVNGLSDFPEVERKRVPGQVLRDAERLECLLFSGYDPHFEGDEPPRAVKRAPPGSHVKCGSPNFSQTGLSDSD
jgi:hypothetical protein